MLAGVLLVAAGCMSFTEGFAAVNNSRHLQQRRVQQPWLRGVCRIRPRRWPAAGCW